MDDDGEESVVYTTEEEDDDDDDDLSDADTEWQESIDQLLLLLNLVLLPFAGKYFGRKLAYLGEREKDGIEKRKAIANGNEAWGRYVEWRYPVDVVYSSKRAFQLAGAAEAAIF